MTDDSTSLDLLVLFDSVTILSLLLIVAIMATAYFSKRVHQPDVWYGQMAQWLIYCISYMLLFGYQRGTKPPQALCLFQASMIYACPPACAVGSACFMANLYGSLFPLHRQPTEKLPRLKSLLIVLPWVTLIGSALQVILFTVASRNLDAVQRSQGYFFCNISHPEPTIVSVILVLLALVVWFYYELQAGIIMYKNRQEFARIKYKAPKASRGFISLYIRSAILTIGMLIGTGVAIYSVCHELGMGGWSVSLPCMPILVALVFGTQEDIVRVWLFWRKPEPGEDPDLSSSFDFTIDEIPIRSTTALT